MSIDEKAFQIALERTYPEHLNVQTYYFRDVVEAYEAAKAEQPDECRHTFANPSRLSGQGRCVYCNVRQPDGLSQLDAYRKAFNQIDDLMEYRGMDKAQFGAIADALMMKLKADKSPVREVVDRKAVASLFNEVDCRIEHGAESGGHLQYVHAALKLILNQTEDEVAK